jgi:DNA-binding MarR family transcriptional regulator
MSEKDLFDSMQRQYVPQRRRNGSKQLNFSRPTLTGWLKMLRKWGLIEQREGDDLRERKIILTDEGIFTARFLMASMADKNDKRK